MSVWPTLHELLAQQQAAVLAVVVESNGSAPGKQGFKMVVSSQARCAGTIGGGIMEGKLIERCKKMLAANSRQNLWLPQIHHKHAPLPHQSGMICSGDQFVCLQPIYPDMAPLVASIMEHEKSQTPVRLILNNNGLSLDHSKDRGTPSLIKKAGHNWHYQETIAAKPTLYIIGGGHVGLAISEIFQHLDFHLVVIDNRAHLETLPENTAAHEIHICDYSQLHSIVKENYQAFTVVVTASFHTDVDALESLLRLPPLPYIGLMGSRSKIKKNLLQLENSRLYPERVKPNYSTNGNSHRE